MNQMPSDWLDQLKQEYPHRSGPMSWPRVFLKVRRALMESNWETLIEGVKRYAKYCQEAGIDGSAFVVQPARFFEDEIYLEDLSFCAAEDPKKAEAKRKEADYLARVTVRASGLGISRYADEPAAALETRCRLAETRGPDRLCDGFATRVSDLAQRMRVTK
jgi:hypothetical protein